MFLPRGKAGSLDFCLKWVTNNPEATKTSEINILKVMGSPSIRPPKNTPETGTIKIKVCKLTAPNRCNRLFQITKPAEAVST